MSAILRKIGSTFNLKYGRQETPQPSEAESRRIDVETDPGNHSLAEDKASSAEPTKDQQQPPSKLRGAKSMGALNLAGIFNEITETIRWSASLLHPTVVDDDVVSPSSEDSLRYPRYETPKKHRSLRGRLSSGRSQSDKKSLWSSRTRRAKIPDYAQDSFWSPLHSKNEPGNVSPSPADVKDIKEAKNRNDGNGGDVVEGGQEPQTPLGKKKENGEAESKTLASENINDVRVHPPTLPKVQIAPTILFDPQCPEQVYKDDPYLGSKPAASDLSSLPTSSLKTTIAKASPINANMGNSTSSCKNPSDEEHQHLISKHAVSQEGKPSVGFSTQHENSSWSMISVHDEKAPTTSLTNESHDKTLMMNPMSPVNEHDDKVPATNSGDVLDDQSSQSPVRLPSLKELWRIPSKEATPHSVSQHTNHAKNSADVHDDKVPSTNSADVHGDKVPSTDCRDVLDDQSSQPPVILLPSLEELWRLPSKEVTRHSMGEHADHVKNSANENNDKNPATGSADFHDGKTPPTGPADVHDDKNPSTGPADVHDDKTPSTSAADFDDDKTLSTSAADFDDDETSPTNSVDPRDERNRLYITTFWESYRNSLTETSGAILDRAETIYKHFPLRSPPREHAIFQPPSSRVRLLSEPQEEITEEMETVARLFAEAHGHIPYGYCPPGFTRTGPPSVSLSPGRIDDRRTLPSYSFQPPGPNYSLFENSATQTKSQDLEPPSMGARSEWGFSGIDRAQRYDVLTSSDNTKSLSDATKVLWRKTGNPEEGTYLQSNAASPEVQSEAKLEAISETEPQAKSNANTEAQSEIEFTIAPMPTSEIKFEPGPTTEPELEFAQTKPDIEFEANPLTIRKIQSEALSTAKPEVKSEDESVVEAVARSAAKSLAKTNAKFETMPWMVPIATPEVHSEPIATAESKAEAVAKSAAESSTKTDVESETLPWTLPTIPEIQSEPIATAEAEAESVAKAVAKSFVESSPMTKVLSETRPWMGPGVDPEPSSGYRHEPWINYPISEPNFEGVDFETRLAKFLLNIPAFIAHQQDPSRRHYNRERQEAAAAQAHEKAVLLAKEVGGETVKNTSPNPVKWVKAVFRDYERNCLSGEVRREDADMMVECLVGGILQDDHTGSLEALVKKQEAVVAKASKMTEALEALRIRRKDVEAAATGMIEDMIPSDELGGLEERIEQQEAEVAKARKKTEALEAFSERLAILGEWDEGVPEGETIEEDESDVGMDAVAEENEMVRLIDCIEESMEMQGLKEQKKLDLLTELVRGLWSAERKDGKVGKTREERKGWAWETIRLALLGSGFEDEEVAEMCGGLRGDGGVEGDGGRKRRLWLDGL